MKQFIYRIDKSSGLKSKDILGYVENINDIAALQSLFCTNFECKQDHVYLVVKYNAGLRLRKRGGGRKPKTDSLSSDLKSSNKESVARNEQVISDV